MTTKAQILRDIRAKLLLGLSGGGGAPMPRPGVCSVAVSHGTRPPQPSRKGNVDNLRSGTENSPVKR